MTQLISNSFGAIKVSDEPAYHHSLARDFSMHLLVVWLDQTSEEVSLDD